MALSPDQTAVLEMMLAGQSYDELAELLGLPANDVEARARAALAELGGADPDRNVALSDYLLGQADPIGRADAVRHLRSDPADHALAVDIVAALAELSPAADLPKLPPAPAAGRFLGGRAAGHQPADQGERQSPLAAISAQRSRLYVGLAAAAVIVVAVVLAATGVFSGDSETPAADDAPPAESGDDPTAGIGEIPDGEELSRVPLTPTGGGGDAAGAAIIGLSTGDQAYVDLVIENLEPAPQGKAYVVWFMFDGKTGYPLSPIFPDDQGSFQDRFAIPAAVTGLISQTRAIEVSLSNARQTLREIQAAAQAETYQITRPGQTILSGRVQGARAPAEDQAEG